jgi:SAM-dependent methyltransferase
VADAGSVEGAPDDVELRVREQVAFYEADAVPYQAWLDELENPENRSAVAVAHRDKQRRLTEVLAGLAPLGRTLEIAAGTGRFSRLLAPHVSTLTLLDSSPTSLQIAEERLGSQTPHAATVVADVFDMDAAALGGFDTIAFAAWSTTCPEPALVSSGSESVTFSSRADASCSTSRVQHHNCMWVGHLRNPRPYTPSTTTH